MWPLGALETKVNYRKVRKIVTNRLNLTADSYHHLRPSGILCELGIIQTVIQMEMYSKSFHGPHNVSTTSGIHESTSSVESNRENLKENFRPKSIVVW